LSENGIFGVCVDIAERRLTIRAAETDTNEGFFCWVLWFHIVVHFSLCFVFF
jgi:hypothetical protein